MVVMGHHHDDEWQVREVGADASNSATLLLKSELCVYMLYCYCYYYYYYCYYFTSVPLSLSLNLISFPPSSNNHQRPCVRAQMVPVLSPVPLPETGILVI